MPITTSRTVRLVAVTLLGLAVATTAPLPAHADASVEVFQYEPSAQWQAVIVPAGVTSAKVTLWGADGGRVANRESTGYFRGGLGAKVSGTMAVQAGHTIIRRGDAERGALLLVISSRGQHVGCLERVLSFDKGYVWQPVGPGESASSADLSAFLEKRARFDEDSWVIELDIAEPERFIAETTRLG